MLVHHKVVRIPKLLFFHKQFELVCLVPSRIGGWLYVELRSNCATKVALGGRVAARGIALWRGGKASVGGWRCQLAFGGGGGVFGGDRVGRFFRQIKL